MKPLDFASEVWEGVLPLGPRKNDSAVPKGEKLENKRYGSLSLRCFPSPVQPRA